VAKVYAIDNDWGSKEMDRIHVLNEGLELQRILERNHDLLPGDQIDPEEPRQWLLIKREMPVTDPGTGQPRWSIDFLFADQEAIPTFVECKRFADTRARREVVGQMIEYAANGHRYWDKDLLRGFAERSLKDGRTLELALTDLQGPGGDSPDEFFDRIQQNLREGQLRLIFFLEDSPPELMSVVEFLNKQMERSEVLLVEARQYRSEAGHIVVPTLFGYTEEARLVKRSVNVVTAGTRRRWDEASYFADAEAKLGEQAGPLRKLYDQLKSEGFGLDWGSGQKAGSFNPRAWDISHKSLISVYSTGWLTLKFGDLPDQCREKLTSLAVNELGLEIRPELKYPSFFVSDWGDKVQGLVSGLVRIVEELRVSEEPHDPAEQ
jgi:hypothetical protein